MFERISMRLAFNGKWCNDVGDGVIIFATLINGNIYRCNRRLSEKEIKIYLIAPKDIDNIYMKPLGAHEIEPYFDLFESILVDNIANNICGVRFKFNLERDIVYEKWYEYIRNSYEYNGIFERILFGIDVCSDQYKHLDENNSWVVYNTLLSNLISLGIEQNDKMKGE